MHISEEERSDFEIYLYDSLIVLFGDMAGAKEDKVCYFYEAFFRLLFSKIFEEEVEVKEKFCSLHRDENRCIFDVRMK
jgi:predicted hydrocarbon binding protein